MMMYKRSEDYVLADKLLRVSGESLAAWLTDADDITTFHLLNYGNDGLCVDGVLQPLIQFQTNFFDYCEVTHAQFLLPVLEDNVKLLPDNIDRFSETVLKRDRTIAILEDNLNRARSEHLEQLRAIVQMLEPLATHEDKGSLYLSHFGKAAMVYMIQKVVYANIEKLDPSLKSYDNNF